MAGLGYQGLAGMGENEEFALNEGVYGIGFSHERDVADFSDYEALRDYLHRQSEGLSLQQVASSGVAAMAFRP